jgi:hypothetical protein
LDQIKLTFGRRTKRLHPDPAFDGFAQKTDTILDIGILAMRHLGSVTRIREDFLLPREPNKPCVCG